MSYDTFFSWTPDDGPGSVVDVSDTTGWDQLEQDYAPSGSLPFERVLELAKELGTASVLVEHRYIDIDYRSEHSRFYSTTFRRYPSVCHRLHFFSEPVSSDLSNLGNLKDAYLGYSVMRPLPNYPVGRTMLRPPPDLATGVVTTASDTVHLFGESFTVTGMPFMSQDAQYLRCAHASQWMVLQHSHLAYGTPRYVPKDIHEASTGGLVVGRQLPSDGLSTAQMLVGLQNLGLSPGSLRLPASRADSKALSHLSLFAVLCRHVNSAMPAIVISDSHAWVVVGYTRTGAGPSHDNIVLYRHDDAMGPYIRVDDPWNEPRTAHTPWRFALPALQSKIYLSGERAEPIGEFWLSALGKGLPQNRLSDALDADRLTFRSYAIRGSEFVADLDGRVPADVAQVGRLTHLPKFVWVVEAIDRDLLDAGNPCVLGEAIIDPTAHHLSAPTDPIFQAILMIHVAGVALAEGPDHKQTTRVDCSATFAPYESYRAPNLR